LAVGPKSKLKTLELLSVRSLSSWMSSTAARPPGLNVALPLARETAPLMRPEPPSDAPAATVTAPEPVPEPSIGLLLTIRLPPLMSVPPL
jgi:hypothetical protein